MTTSRSLAATTRKALCLTLVLFCVGAWLAPVAHAQIVGDVIEDVLDGPGTGSGAGAGSEAGSGDTGGSTDGSLIGGVVDGLEGETDNSTGTSGGDPVGELVNAVDKKAGETTGTVDNATGGTVGNIGQTAGTLPVAGGTVKKITKDLQSGPATKRSDRPAASTGGYQVMDTWEVLGESFTNANTTPTARDAAATTSSEVIEPVSSFDDSVFSQIGRVAAEAVEQAAFPIALILMVVAFLMVQNKIDSKDPKLALAPVDSEHDLLSFT